MTEPEILRNDSIALSQIFSSVHNTVTGIGTSRDGSASTAFTSGVFSLPDDILSSLPRSNRILRRTVELHPASAYQAYFRLKVSGEVNLGEKIQEYLYRIPGRIRYWEAFKKATTLARQFGDSFILVGVNDGQPPAKPVDLTRVKSIERLILCEKRQIVPDRHNPPELYELYELPDTMPADARIWHCSRVLRFSGDEIPDSVTLALNGGYHDSVLQSMFNAWLRWEEAVISSAAMLKDYDVSAFGIKGLARAIADDAAKGTRNNQTAVFQRMATLMTGKSVVRGIVYDMDNEKLEQIQRRYQGAESIVQTLQECLAAASDIPANKLFNRLPQTGLSTGVQAAQIVRSEWAIANNEWTEKAIRPQLEALVLLAIAAKDSPTAGKYSPWEIEFPLNISQSAIERLELEKVAAERDRINIESGIYSSEEARRQYRVPEQTFSIQLEDGNIESGVSEWAISVKGRSEPTIVNATSRTTAIAAVKRENQEAQIVSARRLDRADVLSDDRWESFSEISAKDFIRFATDAIDSI